MIDYITIKNFKSHVDSEIELHKGFNALVGLSTSGKTPVLQAVRLVATNRPLGFGYKNINAPKKEAVEITLGIGNSAVSFTKTTNGATYNIASINELDTKANKDEEFSSFGTSVPDPILDILSIPDSSFRHGSSSRSMLASPTEFSQMVNEITGAEEARKVVKNLKRMISGNAKEQTLLLDNMKQTKQKISQCQKVKKLKPYIIQSKRVHNQIEAKQDQIDIIEDIISLNQCIPAITKAQKTLNQVQMDIEPLLLLDQTLSSTFLI